MNQLLSGICWRQPVSSINLSEEGKPDLPFSLDSLRPSNEKGNQEAPGGLADLKRQKMDFKETEAVRICKK